LFSGIPSSFQIGSRSHLFTASPSTVASSFSRLPCLLCFTFRPLSASVIRFLVLPGGWFTCCVVITNTIVEKQPDSALVFLPNFFRLVQTSHPAWFRKLALLLNTPPGPRSGGRSSHSTHLKDAPSVPSNYPMVGGSPKCDPFHDLHIRAPYPLPWAGVSLALRK